MSEIKRFPPSDAKLERLRHEGIVPFSFLLQSGALILAFLLWIYLFFLKARPDLLNAWQESFVQAGRAAPEAMLKNWSNVVVSELEMFFAVLVVFTLVVGMYQTRALFLLSAFGCDFGRFFRRWKMYLSSFALQRILPAVILVGIIAVLAFCILTFFLASLSRDAAIMQERLLPFTAQTRNSSLSTLLTFQQEVYDQFRRLLVQILQLVTERFEILILLVGLFSLIVGILGRINAVLSFRHEQQMTRSEVEAEQREEESGTLVKERRAEIEVVEK